MEVVWKAQALKDREEIHAFLARASLAHAYATIATIQRAINRLEHYPYLGKQVPHRLNERLLVVPRVSYSVL